MLFRIDDDKAANLLFISIYGFKLMFEVSEPWRALRSVLNEGPPDLQHPVYRMLKMGGLVT
jgi:hypothetical protein